MQNVELFVAKRTYTQRRRHERVPVDFPVRVQSESLRLADRALDVSECGVRLSTGEPLAPMSLITVQLEVPHLHAPVSVLARVMWTTGTTMGIRFEQHDPVLLDAVERLRKELHVV